MIDNYYEAKEVGEIIKDDESIYSAIGVLTDGDDQPYYYWYDPDNPNIVLPISSMPSMNKDRIDFNLIDAKKNFTTGYLSLNFTIDDKFFWLKRIGEKEFQKNDNGLKENISVFVNDELYDTIEFNPENCDEDLIYHLDVKKDVNYENINIKFVSENIMNVDVITEVINLNTSNETNYSFDFNDSLTEKIISPIGFVDDNLIFETLSFTKMFDNLYKSPLTTNEIISMDYVDSLNKYQWTLENHIEATLDLGGYKENQKINFSLSQDDEGESTYFTNDKFYYNEDNKKVYSGLSEDYLNEEGIVLPWDLRNNKGTLEFALSFKTYQDYHINFKLNIGNEFPLRGKDGKFYFKEVYSNE